mmetsp:Transcript_14370/g.38085  ORF Transcript_14370/g.38085 Transcript_14370/m.38085 type:complete len:238 (+) Transcript_14370:245-958(+)
MSYSQTLPHSSGRNSRTDVTASCARRVRSLSDSSASWGMSSAEGERVKVHCSANLSLERRRRRRHPAYRARRRAGSGTAQRRAETRTGSREDTAFCVSEHARTKVTRLRSSKCTRWERATTNCSPPRRWRRWLRAWHLMVHRSAPCSECSRRLPRHHTTPSSAQATPPRPPTRSRETRKDSRCSAKAWQRDLRHSHQTPMPLKWRSRPWLLTRCSADCWVSSSSTILRWTANLPWIG